MKIPTPKAGAAHPAAPHGRDAHLQQLVDAVVVGMEHTRSEIVAALESTVRGVPQRGALVKQVVDGANNGATITTSSGRLAGINLRETTGSGYITLQLLDSRDLSGDPILDIALSGGASTVQWFMPEGIGYSYGLTVSIVGRGAGSLLAGQVYLAGQ